MRFKHSLVATAAIVFSGLLLSTVTASAKPTVKYRAREFGIAPGAGFFLNQDKLGPGLDDFLSLKIHTVRSIITWRNFEPDKKGTYVWKSVDRFIQTASQDKYKGKFQFIVTLDSPPEWANTPANVPYNTACKETPPFDLQAYADATAELAKRLNGVANVFEIQNSPNIAAPGTAWTKPDPCAYAQLLKMTHKAVHAQSLSKAPIVLVGGIGGMKDTSTRIAGDEFLADLYRNGAKGSFDGVAYHPYSSPYLPCDPKDVDHCQYNSDPKSIYGPQKNSWDRMLNARAIMVANKDDKLNIWITEYGTPSTGSGNETLQVTLQNAAFQRASQESWIGPLCIFTYMDDDVSGSAGDTMGIVKSDGTRKPAYYAYKALSNPHGK